MFFGGPAVICSLLSPKGKRIGDVFAGTVVISERGPKLPPPPVMPPSLAWWASSLQLSGLGPEQAELARQFLSRASQLDPQIRDQMALPDRRRRGRADLAAAAAGRPAAVRARRGAGRAAPTGAGHGCGPRLPSRRHRRQWGHLRRSGRRRPAAADAQPHRHRPRQPGGGFAPPG